MEKPRVGDTSDASSPASRFTTVVLPALSRPLPGSGRVQGVPGTGGGVGGAGGRRRERRTVCRTHSGRPLWLRPQVVYSH